ncbi:hypothetical protein [Brevundimonas aurifodinae]|uniref:Terminase n=2 Tax=Brevundimonas TaxID=41275 RepID=A0ABV1NMC4_9CAUL|nr:MAG: hypothetical protein B7Z42_03145 [Brevundimonas sp. 12-68-7]OYX34759.1 MAG: hypothetical protein B7Z01_04240 [Brevundimonas subvibrioides]
MTEAPLNRRPHKHHTPDEWAEIKALYVAGATAKCIAADYGCSERKIYARAGDEGWLRRDLGAEKPPMTPEAADARARAISGAPADAAVRALKADADLAAATRAAVRTTVGMLRDGHPARAYAYGRLAALMIRLDRVLGEVEGEGSAGGRTPQQEAALAAILARLGVEG